MARRKRGEHPLSDRELRRINGEIPVAAPILPVRRYPCQWVQYHGKSASTVNSGRESRKRSRLDFAPHSPGRSGKSVLVGFLFATPVWNRSDRRVPGGSTIRVVVTTPKIIASRFPLTRNVRSPKLPTVRHTARLPQGQRASPGELSQRRSNSFGRNELALVVSRPGGITDVHGAVAKWLRQRIANPPSSVRIRSAPLWKAKVLRAQTAVSWLFSCPSETWIGAGGTVSVPNTPLCHPPQPEQLVNPAKPVSNAGWKRAHSAQSDLHFLGRTSSNGTIGRVLSSHLLTTRNP
jgi:hypothetical protein